MRVLVAMSGGVDSSVAAALLLKEGHEIVGATMKLWGGSSDSGCCSAADVADARRVADRLGIDHYVFNLAEEFEEGVVAPYVEAHAAGRTPNPCADCNRTIKFAAFAGRARRLGFEAVATGHHARIEARHGFLELRRGADRAKDQSYVLAMLTADELADALLPVGELDKADVRALARRLGLRTADKPDSQDVCFIASRTPGAGRAAFLAERLDLHPGRVLDARSGAEVGTVAAVELVTVGQRRGLSVSAGEARYALAVDVAARTVTVGPAGDLDVGAVALERRTWVNGPLPDGTEVLVQTSAHGAPRPGRLEPGGVALPGGTRRVAPGQLVALYLGETVVGSGVAAAGTP